MPTFQENLRSAIQGRFSGRVYPVAAVAEAVAPYCVYQRVGGESITDMADGKGVLQHSRIQFDIWDPDYANAHATAELISTDLVASSNFKSVRIAPALDFGYEDETQLYRVMVEHYFWHT